MEEQEYKVRLDIFEGPLDLLLYLIRREELDITEVSLEKITHSYLEYIETFRMLNIDLASEFVVMAANLIYMKSRTLLPKQEQPPEDDAEDDDPRWDLIRQLIEYKKFKDAAGYLAQREVEQEGYFPHNPEKPELPPVDINPVGELSIFDLIQAFQKVLKRFETEHDFGQIVDDRFTVSDKVEYLLIELQPGQVRRFESLFETASTKIEVIVTFLAVLELMKMNQFKVRQDRLLGDIDIERRAGN
ncbi:MAG: segregation/condensation protein A [Verrucomicrobiota bacterium JB023]|nr:segregation/condensation protein A [Verrucomicrobiota bacterium JB023]